MSRAPRCASCGRFTRRLVPGGEWATCSRHGILRVDPPVRWTYELLGFYGALTDREPSLPAPGGVA